MLGYNYRLSDILAALGLSQLTKLKKFIKIRNQLAKNYDNLIMKMPVKKQKIEKGNISSYHLYIILLDLKSQKARF